MRLLLAITGIVKASSSSCAEQWESQINKILDETQTLLFNIESTVVNGLNGNYTARITNALDMVKQNIESCPFIAELSETLYDISEAGYNCDYNIVQTELHDLFDNAYDRRERVDKLISLYESYMEEINDINRQLKNEVYVKDIFGRGKTLLLNLSLIIRAVKENVEVDTVNLLREGKSIRETSERGLLEAEETFKYVSHDVDLLIYSTEPLVAYLGVDKFNQVLCGTDITYGCDSKNGGIFCEECGEGPNTGAKGLILEAEKSQMATRLVVQKRIEESEHFVNTAFTEKIEDASISSLEQWRQQHELFAEFAEHTLQWAGHAHEIISFLLDVFDSSTPRDILDTADSVLNMELSKFPEDLEQHLSSFNFYVAEPQILTQDGKSESYRLARDFLRELSAINESIQKFKSVILDYRYRKEWYEEQAMKDKQNDKHNQLKTDLENKLIALDVLLNQYVGKTNLNIENSTILKEKYERAVTSFEKAVIRIYSNLNAVKTTFKKYKHTINGVDQFIENARMFQSIEQRSYDLVKNVQTLRQEVYDQYQLMMEMKPKIEENQKLTQELRSDISLKLEKVKLIRENIYNKHNVDNIITSCPELYKTV